MRMTASAMILGSCILTGLVGGCAPEPRSPIGEPWTLMHALLKRNQEAIGFEKVSEPEELSRNLARASLEYFEGGVALRWSSEGNLESRHPRLFDRTGRFLCRAVRFITVDMTGDGVRDVVATAWDDGTIHFLFYDMAERQPVAIRLGGLPPTSLGPRTFPDTCDFNGDRVLEIACYSRTDLLCHDGGLDVPGLKREGVEKVLVVWSFLSGAPHAVLAFDGRGIYFEPPAVTEMFVNGERVEYDAGLGKFRIPESAEKSVLLNRAIPKLPGS